jgi:hypothetical protein
VRHAVGLTLALVAILSLDDWSLAQKHRNTTLTALITVWSFWLVYMM